MKSFLLSILICTILIFSNTYSQNIISKLAGHSTTNGFTVTDDEDKVLFKITGNGNVGINTATPTNLFEIFDEYTTDADGKSIVINAQSSESLGGSITLQAGFGFDPHGGDLNLYAGGSYGYGGDINLISGTTGSAGHSSGDINIKTNNSNNGTGGDITISTDGDNYIGGNIYIKTGDVDESGSDIAISAGSTGGVIGGSVLISAGDGGNGGNIIITPGLQTNSGIDGLVKIMGSGTYTGTWTQASDLRFKKNIEPIEISIEKIDKLNGVNYELRKDEFPEKKFSDGKQIGLIAQDVEKVFPELVRTDNEGYKSVDYTKLSVILLEGIKLQQKQLAEQSAKIDDLEKRIQSIENNFLKKINTVSN